jgi:hypothetical protein
VLTRPRQEDEDEIDDTRARLAKLLKKQEPIESFFNRLSVHRQGRSHAQTPKPPSPKATRPNLHGYATYPTPYPTSGYDHVQQPHSPTGYDHVPLPRPSSGYGHAPPPRPSSGWGHVHPPHSPTEYDHVQSPHSPTGYGHAPPPRPSSGWGHVHPPRPTSGWGHVKPPRPTSGFAYVDPPQPPPPPPRPHAAPMWGGIGEVPLVPPPAPEIPTSPTYSSASSHSHSIQSTDSGEPKAHWAMKILDGRHSSTLYRVLGERTDCLGRDEPRVIELLDTDGFMKVLEMPFESTDVWVRLYWRAEDNRARILFLTKDASGRRMRYCLPLTGLKILRVDDCLQLCRINRKDGQLDLWARLRFVQHEREHSKAHQF